MLTLCRKLNGISKWWQHHLGVMTVVSAEVQWPNNRLFLPKSNNQFKEIK